MSDIKKINIKFEPEKIKINYQKREITNTIEWIETENKYTHQNKLIY